MLPKRLTQVGLNARQSNSLVYLWLISCSDQRTTLVQYQTSLRAEFIMSVVILYNDLILDV